MKIINKNEIEKNSEGSVYPYIIFGIFIISYVIYCLIQSTSECVLFFGKSGLVEDCSDNKNIGYGSLAISGLLGVFFCVLGVLNLFRKKQQKGNSV